MNYSSFQKKLARFSLSGFDAGINELTREYIRYAVQPSY